MRAIVILHDGIEPSSTTQGVILRSLAANEEATEVRISCLSDEETANALIAAAHNDKLKLMIANNPPEEVSVKDAVSRLIARYADIITDKGKLFYQVLVDVNQATMDAEEVKNCIKVIATYKRSLKPFKVPEELLAAVKTMYNEHLV